MGNVNSSRNNEHTIMLVPNLILAAPPASGAEAKVFLSIVLPVFNEHKVLPGFLNSLHSYLRFEFPDEVVEIVVIDNGSTDSTNEVLPILLSMVRDSHTKTLSAKYTWSDYSEAVRRGVLSASGDRIMWLGVDIDDLACIGRASKVMDQSNAEIVLLSKYEGADRRPLIRIMLNRSYNAIVRVFDGLWYSDVEGYVMVTKGVKPIFRQLGFSRMNTLNLNLIYFCKRLRFRIRDAPLYVKETRKSVFLKGLPRIVIFDLASVLQVHKRFKRYSIECRTNEAARFHKSRH